MAGWGLGWELKARATMATVATGLELLRVPLDSQE